MTLQITLMFLFLMANIYENYWREINRGEHWHIVQFVSWVTFAVVATNYDIKLMLVYSAIWWIVYSGMLNVLRGKLFWEVSKTSTNPIEKYSEWYIKIPYLIIVTLVYIL